MAQEKIRVGVVGLTHDHIWSNLEALSQLPNALFVGAADPNPPLLERVRERYGAVKLYTRYQDLWEQESLDAVFIFADNRTSALLAVEALERGLHVMVEKPMAASLALADRALTASRRANRVLMVNWPTYWSPAIRYAAQLVREGAIGRPFKFRYAAGHQGPKEIGCSPFFYSWLYNRELNGAGAYMDYCGYGASLSRWLLGYPSRVQASAGRLTKDYIDVDDAAILLLRYPRAFSVIEGTWGMVGRKPGPGPIIWGTEGTLLVSGSGRESVVELCDRQNPEGRTLTPPPLPEGERNGPEYFLRCITENRPVEGQCDPVISRDAQEILEAGLESIRTGTEVALPFERYLFA